MEVPISIFLFAYLIYLVIFLFFSYFNLYHIIHYGFVSPIAYIVTIGYIVLTLFGLFISYYYIAQVDWNQVFSIGFAPMSY